MKIFYVRCYLVVVCQSSTYEIVKVIKSFRKLASKDSGIIFMIIIIDFYNDDDDDYYYYNYYK